MDCFHQLKFLLKFEYGFWSNDNHDGRQNGRLLVCTCGHSTLVCFQISFIDYFYLAQVRMWAMSNNKDGPLNLVIYHPNSSKFHLRTTFIILLFICLDVFFFDER